MNRKIPVRFKPALPPAAQTRPDPAALEQALVADYAPPRRPGLRLEQIARVSQAAKNYCGEPRATESYRRDDEAQRCMSFNCCAKKRNSRDSEVDSDSDDAELERIIRGLSKSRN